MFVLLSSLVISSIAQAQDAVVSPFKGESEASVVIVEGNSSSRTHSAKTKNEYKLDEKSLVTFGAGFLQASAAGVETSRSWNAALRYDFIFQTDVLSLYLQRKAESDPFNGVFVQRDVTDFGAKYVIERSEKLTWFAELGYQSQDTYAGIVDATREVVPFAKIYTEAEYKFNESTKTKLWIEHLPNLKKSAESQSNAELSLSVAMSKVFSLKTAYLINRNNANVDPVKKDNSKWTTALVANY